MSATSIRPEAQPTPGGPKERLDHVRPELVIAGVLLVAGILISAFSIRRDIIPLDEGLVPYRDFSTAYGPLQPYLLAGLFKLFGVSLMQWRVLRVFSDGATALVAYLLVRPFVPRPFALAAWLGVVCALAAPRVPDPY